MPIHRRHASSETVVIIRGRIQWVFYDDNGVEKLDKYFHIYVHGGEQLIEQEYDEVRGMKYYKLYYKEEN